MWPIANSLSEKDMWEIADYYSKMPIKISVNCRNKYFWEKLYRGGKSKKRNSCLRNVLPWSEWRGKQPCKISSFKEDNMQCIRPPNINYKDGARKHNMMNSISSQCYQITRSTTCQSTFLHFINLNA